MGCYGLAGSGWAGGTGRKSPSGVRPSRWRLCVRALAKQCFASKAPSPMGARWRHPWRQRSCLPTPTRPARASLRRTARALGFQVERGGRSVFLRKTDLTPEATRLLLFALLSSIRGGRARKLSVAGRVGCAGVSAAWMPRPSPQGRVHGGPCATHPPGPNEGNPPLSATTPRGLRRWLDIQITRKRKRPSAGPGRSRTSGQAGIRIPASLHRPVRWPSDDHLPCGGPAARPGPVRPVRQHAGPGLRRCAGRPRPRLRPPRRSTRPR